MTAPTSERQFSIPEGTTTADFEVFLANLVKENPGLAETINAELDQLRATIGDRLKVASTVDAPSSIELSVEQSELLTSLQAQYPTMVASLEKRKISTAGVPTWEQIKKGLTPEVLDKALKLAEPALNLVAPTTRQSKVKAIDEHKVTLQKHDTFTYQLANNDLWNGGKAKTENKWIVSVDEGVQEVEADPEINDGKKTNYQMATEWAQKLKDQGLDVLEGADAYLTLMMRGLDSGKPIDEKFFTVLNAKNLTKSSLVAGGGWRYDRVSLNYDHPVNSFHRLRLRGSVGVDVPQA